MGVGSSKNKEVRVLLLGLDNAGKTSILKHLAGEKITQIMPTKGFNVKSISEGDVTLNVWDLGGQKSIRSYWRNYYDGTEALIYVIDSADRARVEETGLELFSLLEQDKLANIPLLIFSNKMDLMTAMTAAEVTDALNLMSVRDRSWHLEACCAKTGMGLQEGLDWLTNKLGVPSTSKKKKKKKKKSAKPQKKTKASSKPDGD